MQQQDRSAGAVISNDQADAVRQHDRPHSPTVRPSAGRVLRDDG